MKIEKTRPYFPFVLANGIDSVMIDYSGSMCCDSGHIHTEQLGGAVCAWEKTTNRSRFQSMFPNVQCPYQLQAGDGELVEIGSFKQKFDPVRSVMLTTVESSIIHLKISTFLTEDHIYAEQYEVLWSNESVKPQIIFMAKIPNCKHRNPLPEKYDIDLRIESDDTVIGEYWLNEIKGNILMHVQSECETVAFPWGHKHMSRLLVKNLKKGDTITRCISTQDNTHTKNPKQACKAAIEQVKRDGIAAVRKKHEAQWKKFHAATPTKLPDKEMQDIYRKSLWLIRASQIPKTGFLSEGLFDAFKQGGYGCYWDYTFSIRALATSNQRESLTKVLDFYQSTVDCARKYAKDLGKTGAFFPWFANHTGFHMYYDNATERPDIQKWNNGCQGIQLFDPYRYWGDTDELAKRLPLIKEIIDFLIDEIIEKVDGKYRIKLIGGADENIDRLNDTAHLVSTLKAIEGYIDGSEILEKTVDAHYCKMRDGLREALKGNYKDDVILPWAGAELKQSKTPFSLDMLMQPDGVSEKSIRKSYRDSQGEWGLSNPGTYRNLIWPWTECRAATAFTRIDPKISYQRLKHVLPFSSSHGIFPEKIRPDGFWILFGYLTAHASFVYGVNSLLATDNRKTLFISAGIPKDWQDLSFKNIYTASGFGVSMKLVKGKIKKLVIENTRSHAQKIKIKVLNKDFGKEAINKTLALKSGKNRII